MCHLPSAPEEKTDVNVFPQITLSHVPDNLILSRDCVDILYTFTASYNTIHLILHCLNVGVYRDHN